VLTGIDHLVIAVADPDEAASSLESSLGLTPGGGGRHEALGTFNRLVWLGDTYLELIGIFDPELAAASWLGAPTVRALAGGRGLVTWAVASDDIRDDVRALRERGSDIGEPDSGERLRPDGQVVRWTLATAPRLDRDLPPFLIEHDPTGAEWTPEDRDARQADPARLTTLEIAVGDVAATIGRYLRTTGLRFRPSLAGGGARDTTIGDQTVRIRPQRDPRVPTSAIHLAIAGAAQRELDLLGCRWIIRGG
jgi:Glyoxalase-like domain